MKKLFVLLLVAFTINVNAQDAEKTVTLIVSGQGKTQDEAKQNALRSAIEQAFGAFISSKTEILNDDLVKDEIVSISNGNIQKFDVISEVKTPDGNFATSLKAIVSVTQLTSFVQSKGVEIEFKGSLFAFNINQQILNENNELKLMEDLCVVIRKLSDASFDYSIQASDPISINNSSKEWRIPIKISVSPNKNFVNCVNYFYQTLKGLSLSIDEAKNYTKLGKKVYPVSFAANEKENAYLLFRTENSIETLVNQIYYFNYSLQNFKITNGISEWQLIEYPNNIKHIYDDGFRIFIKKGNNGQDWESYNMSSLFYKDCINMGHILEIKDFDQMGDFRNSYLILDYLTWVKSIDLTKFQAFHSEHGRSKDIYFVDQFEFVKKIKNEPGLVISFIGIKSNKEIVRFYYDDIKSLDEIRRINGYKIIPTAN